MSHATVYAAVSTVVPCRHIEWPDDSAPALPWAVYLGEDTPICAGDVQIAVKRRWTVELYEKRRDSALEQSLASALRDAFGEVRRSESYVEKEGMVEIIYTFYEIEGEFDG